MDPRNQAARAALRSIDIPTWHWSAYENAVEPRDEASLAAAGLWVYAWMGQLDKALRIGEQAAVLDPNQRLSHLSLGVLQAYVGDRIAANRSLQKAVNLAPAFPLTYAWLAYNHIAMGDAASGLEKLREIEQLLGSDRQIVYLPELAYGYSRIGRREDVERLLNEMQSIEDARYLGAGAWAVAYVAIGDEQRSLEQLEVVAEKARNHEPDQGYLNVMNLKMNYLADPRLDKPEFVDVLGRIAGD